MNNRNALYCIYDAYGLIICRNEQFTAYNIINPKANDVYCISPPYFQKIYNLTLFLQKVINFPLLLYNLHFLLNLRFLLAPMLTMMHLRIMFYVYWITFFSKSIGEFVKRLLKY